MRFAAIVLFIFLSVAVIAQQQQPAPLTNKAQLEARRKEIQDAINETEQQLEAIKNDKKATMGQLHALQNKLAQRQTLISNINDELGDIDNDIKSSSKEVGSLKQKLEQLKIRYAQSIRYAYTTRSSYDMLAFLFSSHDFNDGMRRMKYLKKFREFRKQQVVQIRTTQAELQHKIGTLNAEKAQKDELLTSQEMQKQALVKESAQTNQVIQDLKGKESELLKSIEKNRKIAANMNKAINDFIQREMAKAQKEAELAAAKAAAGVAKGAATTPAGTKPTATKPIEPATAPPNAGTSTKHKPSGVTPTLLLTPTDVALANNFEGNKGKLYWPVEKGYITGHYGMHPHPIEHQVIVNNDGVDIQTDANSTIRAVFDGEVLNVFNVTGSSLSVMIKHGNYFTVYNGIASPYVKKGDQVHAKQPLGQVVLNDDNLPIVNFQIWHFTGKGGNKTLDPEQWMGRAH